MKQTLRYAAWAWQMSRRGLAALLSLATLAQAGLLVTAILLPQNVNLSYDALHQAAKLPWVFGVSYLGAALLTQRPLLARQGGSRPAFTILTFRMRRAQLLAGQALATALNLFLVMVWQLALLAALCLPALVLQDALTAHLVDFAVPAAGRLWWSWSACGLVRALLPATMYGAACWGLLLLAPALTLPALAAHRGIHRAAALLPALGAACCCLGAVYRGFYGPVAVPPLWVLPVCGLALAGLTALSGVWALHRAEIAR